MDVEDFDEDGNGQEMYRGERRGAPGSRLDRRPWYFDWKITPGLIITIVLILIGQIVSYVQQCDNVKALDTRVTAVEKSQGTIASQVNASNEKLARIDERTANMSTTLQTLSSLLTTPRK